MELLSPPSLLLFSLSLLLLLLASTRRRRPAAGAYPPNLKPYPILGHLPQFLANRHRSVDWIAESLAAAPTNTFVMFRPGGVRGVMTANPANVEHILRSRFDNYPKGPRFIDHLHDFLGDGIFNSDGETWRLQRKTASFEFNTGSLRSFVVRAVQDEIESRLLPLLRKASLCGQPVDLQDVLERFAFDNVCKVSFGLDPACLDPDDGEEQAGSRPKSSDFASTFAEAFKDATDLSAGRFRYAVPRFWKVRKAFDVGPERRLREAIATVHGFADQIIRSRKKESPAAAKPDLLSRFVAGPARHSDEFLRDIVISFLLAGRETTSSGLSWFFWLLASHPEVEGRILEEVRSARARSRSRGSGFDFDELREMHYLHAAITEAMRLYPPVPINSFAAREDDVLPDGTAVEKGMFVAYASYAMGRIEANWGPDCAEYRPERWLEAGGAFRPESPFKFVAFHAGPRVCLGKEMAYIQMKSVAACVLEAFAVEVEQAGACPEKVAALTLRMKGGLRVRVRERPEPRT